MARNENDAVEVAQDDAPKDASRLSEPSFRILLALADGAKHGYGVMREVREHSAGSCRLWPATLYNAMKRMLRDGLLDTSAPPSKDQGEDPRRRFYRLTRAGRARLESEARRLDALVREARAKDVLPRENEQRGER